MRLVFATNNRHKLEEVRAVLGDGVELVTPRELGITEDIPETADTLSGNALQKARYVFERVGGEARAVPSLRGTFGDVFAVFADDTGLEVDALGGAPGVYSARYAAMDPDFHGWSGACLQDPRPVATPGDGLTSHPLAGDGGAEIIGHPSYDDNCRLLLKNLQGATNRSARFRTVIALITGGGGGLGGEEHLFEGEVRGTIIEEYRGAGGFGYDPIFVPLCPENPRTLTFSEMSAEQKNAISHRARAVEKLAEFLKGRRAKKQKNNETIR